MPPNRPPSPSLEQFSHRHADMTKLRKFSRGILACLAGHSIGHVGNKSRASDNFPVPPPSHDVLYSFDHVLTSEKDGCIASKSKVPIIGRQRVPLATSLPCRSRGIDLAVVQRALSKRPPSGLDVHNTAPVYRVCRMAMTL
nr:hypothetical protein CFP56_63474 [Quercus suber]